ncbi:MAG: hypothetical protein LBN29_04200 [Mediterranea sp.]|jgi:hypothetical protein|nr:hypothetical protein [Mediterranea sp.]
MKKNHFLALSLSALALGGALALQSCDDKEEGMGGPAPVILFQVDNLSVDFNTADRPLVVSVIQSEVGLKEVDMYILKAGGAEEAYGDAVTSFDNPNSYSISASVTFSEDMTGFRVVAIDRGNQKSEKELPFHIIPLRTAPVIVFNGDAALTEITYHETSPMPPLAFTVTSEEELNYVAVSQVINGAETPVPVGGEEVIYFTQGETSYTLDMVDALAYQFAEGITAIKVTVGAGPSDNIKEKVATLYINYIALAPAPDIALTTTAANLNGLGLGVPFSLAGTVTSQGTLTDVRIIVTDNGGDETAYPVEIEDATSVDLSTVTILATPTLAFVRVSASDANGKQVVSSDLPIYVGYSMHRMLVSCSGAYPFDDPALLPLFSATHAQAFGYVEAWELSGYIDVGFASYSSTTQISVVNIPNAISSQKFAAYGYNPRDWEVKREVFLKAAAGITRINFDDATIEDIQREEAPTDGSLVALTTGSFANPVSSVALFATEIDGVMKRVLIAYDGLEKPLDEAPANAGTRFYIKVKIEK